MKEDLYIYDILSDIYKGDSYGERALNRSRAKGGFVTRAVYGVLERDTHYEYVISKLVAKRPKPYAVILLKMGFYMLDYMDSVPDYAAVNRILDCAETLGKGAVKGFLNAVFQKYSCKLRVYLKETFCYTNILHSKHFVKLFVKGTR